MIERRWLPSSFLRLLQRPRRVGQKRYILMVDLTRSHKRKSDPSYLMAYLWRFIGRPYGSLLIKEEIAVAGPNGRLHWIGARHFNHNYLSPSYQPSAVRWARKTCHQLNCNPLGVTVSQTTDSNGYLIISQKSLTYRDKGSDEKTLNERRFDITDSHQAEAAIEHYEALSQECATLLDEEIKEAIENAKRSDNKRERALFADRDLIWRRSQAERFGQALERGNIESFRRKLNAEIDNRNRHLVAAKNAHDQQMARRARRTIQAISSAPGTPEDD